MVHIHVSIRTPIQPYGIILYTIYPCKPVSESIVRHFYEVLNKEFLQPLQENKVIPLESTYEKLFALFFDSIRVDYATHWFVGPRSWRAKTEKIMCSMTDMHFSFMLINGTEHSYVHMNEEDSMERLVALFS
jgi:hypothetical protein